MNIKIETLTPVHIGSGNLLHYNTDFFSVVVQTNGTRYLRVADDRKILDLIGPERLQDWVLSIERGQNIKEFMKIYAPNARPVDYSRRKIRFFGDDVSKADTLKECIHNGMGFPYIPGSSIKGALRTAITASLAATHPRRDYCLKNLKGRYDGSVIEKQLFGSDSNKDVFRFMQCGDAYFSKGTEVAFLLQMYLNITRSNDLHPTQNIKPQFIEAIGCNASSEFQLNLETNYYDWVKTQQHNSVGEMPDAMKSVSGLFRLVNQHTLSLVNQEIDFWSELNKTGADDYIESMKDMQQRIEALIVAGNSSCILRIGHAIGWNFITGGWARNTQDFDNIKYAARPNNNKYVEYDFPKSRRLDSDGEMIGFVKLSVL
jgi:CRISPR type III-A-associated RAMP protein Csm5